MTAPTPLDWPSLVEEALRRRRAEGLTQKEHAALAGVSVPTLIAFERGRTTLSLAKAMDILGVVGLVAERAPADAQDAFVAAAEARWTELVADLPEDAPARMPHGHYAFDYAIAGAKAASGKALLAALREAGRPKYTEWRPPFWVPEHLPFAPYPVDGGIECWLGSPDARHAFIDAASSDFWRAGLDGRLYLRRGHLEDSTYGQAPATVFDLTWPIWRAADVLRHARRLATALKAGASAEVRLRVRYAGLAGRQLKSGTSPNHLIYQDHRARTDAAVGAVACPAGAIGDRLPDLVRTLLAPVYERFDFFALPPALVAEELDRLKAKRR